MLITESGVTGSSVTHVTKLSKSVRNLDDQLIFEMNSYLPDEEGNLVAGQLPSIPVTWWSLHRLAE